MGTATAANNRVYCSELAKQADTSLHGSAVQVDTWLLIEYPRPWKPKALLDNDLPEAINSHLAQLPGALSALCGERLRIQFIKQAASADMRHPLVMLSSARGLTSTRLENYQALLSVQAEQLAVDKLPGEQVGLHAAGGGEAAYLVCTNGQRDVCCARFGLPVYETLRGELGQRVWQTTHVGGHRYAANLLSLPSGVLYGFVEPDQALALAAALDNGEINLPHLRGRSAYPPAAQAAEYYLRLEQDDIQLHSLQLVAHREVEPTFSESSFALNTGDIFDVKVDLQVAGEAVASCDGAPKPVQEYKLLEISSRS